MDETRRRVPPRMSPVEHAFDRLGWVITGLFLVGYLVIGVVS